MKYLNIKIPIEMFREESNNRIFQFLKDFSGEFCDNEDTNFRSFHYFFEGDYKESRLEIRIDSNHEEEITFWLKEFFGNYRFDNIKIEEFKIENSSIQYDTEWDLVEKFFEYTSRISIKIRNNEPQNLFRETKFIHCFLNQLGYDSLGEASFHNWTSGQILMKYLKQQKFY